MWMKGTFLTLHVEYFSMNIMSARVCVSEKNKERNMKRLLNAKDRHVLFVYSDVTFNPHPLGNLI